MNSAQRNILNADAHQIELELRMTCAGGEIIDDAIVCYNIPGLTKSNITVEQLQEIGARIDACRIAVSDGRLIVQYRQPISEELCKHYCKP